jgi:polyisoprenoid-binding protein YceI
VFELAGKLAPDEFITRPGCAHLRAATFTLLSPLILLTALLTAGGPASAGSQEENGDRLRYRIDAPKSRFIVRAFAAGLFSAFAHDHTIAVRDFDGEARFTPDDSKSASLRITVKAASLAVIDNVSEGDRKEIESTMREQVLEVSKYPDIVFRSTSLSATQSTDGSYKINMAGDLALHGVTRKHRITATADFDGQTLRAKGEFPLLQTDYAITPVSIALGTVRVKDELKISFEMVATKE